MKLSMARALAIFVLFFAPFCSSALEIRQTLWGFNGQVTPDAFNPLSVLVDNPSPAPFSGALMLREGGVANSTTSGYVEPIYIAPGTTRWVQFYPFLNDERNWELTWGTHRGESLEVPKPTWAAPAQVFFTDPEEVLGAASHFKSFPDNLFPPAVTATDALASVVLDHVPRWEPVRRVAFLDWIRRGGTLHLLRGRDGTFPIFTEDLAALNFMESSSGFGAGRVVHHDLSRTEATEEKLHQKLPQLLTPSSSGMNLDLETTFFQRLAALTKPDINWRLIYLLAFAYLGLIGPAHYFWGRRKQSRRVIGCLFLLVFLFGGAFRVVGHRGFDEISAVHSLAWARSLGEGRWDTFEWGTVFVTRGDRYTISHVFNHNLYAAAPYDGNSTAGQIIDGKEGGFKVDIPRYSSRAYIHRAVVEAADFTPSVDVWKEDSDLAQLDVQLKGKPPENIRVAWVFRRGRFYDMTAKDSNHLSLGKLRRSPAEFFNSQNLYGSMIGYNNLGPNFPGVASDLLPFIIARATGAPDVFIRGLDLPPLPDDTVQLFILADSPPNLHPTGKDFSKAAGCVVYEMKIFKPTHPS